jgi:hypothetical protein
VAARPLAADILQARDGIAPLLRAGLRASKRFRSHLEQDGQFHIGAAGKFGVGDQSHWDFSSLIEARTIRTIHARSRIIIRAMVWSAAAE